MSYIIDAKNKKLGRLASEIAVVLQGKNKASFEFNKAGEEKVVVKNAKLVELSGRKKSRKFYYRHSGFTGGLKKIFYKEAFGKSPADVIKNAVRGMLPSNKLRNQRLKRLVIE